MHQAIKQFCSDLGSNQFKYYKDMRKGQVLAYNKTAGVGLINDANDERIKFYTNGKDRIPARGDEVSFKIGIRKGNLAAIKVSIMNSPITINTSHLIQKIT
jgi:cold shock CspA family protein